MNSAVANPRGRLDVLLLRLGEELTRRVVDPAVSRLVKRPVMLWDGLLQPIAAAAVQQAKIPARPLTPEDVVKALSGKPKRRRACIR